MGRTKKYESPRAYICSRKNQIQKFRKLYPEQVSDYDKVEAAISEIKELRLK